MIRKPEISTISAAARRTAFVLATGSALICGSALAATPFVIDAVQAPATLDPAYVCDITDNGYVSPLYATLLAYPRKEVPGPDGVTVTAEDTSRVIGGLAQDYTVSDDGLTITLTLREGITFASGTPIDAAAVAASLKRALGSGACGTYFMEAAQFGNTKADRGAGCTNSRDPAGKARALGDPCPHAAQSRHRRCRGGGGERRQGLADQITPQAPVPIRWRPTSPASESRSAPIPDITDRPR